MLQIILVLAIFTVLIIPMGKYLYHITSGEKTFADAVFNPVDNALFRICGIDRQEMNWKRYTLTLLAVNAVMLFMGYAILRLQAISILNPNGIGAMEQTLSFNTVISFMTNTNLQHYSGESGVSYLSQMAVIIFMMFTSAATGLAAAMAFMRGITGTKKDGEGMGNFYYDMIRVTTRILLPISAVGGLFLVFQGVPQNLSPNLTVRTIEGTYQDIAMGPAAALEIIKHLGTNGGGFLGANSSTPIENPNVITNITEMLSMMLLPGACVVAFGHMIRNSRKKTAQKGANSWFPKDVLPIFAVMSAMFIIGIAVCYTAESKGNPLLESIGLGQSQGSMEGKETRFGIAQSALFTTVTTCFTTGSVNNMHDTLTPLGGAVPLVNMMLNVIFGGDGVGLMNMVLYAILAVFICGLMVGRTPEYLGKKIEGREMKLAAIGIIVHPLLILAFSALAAAVSAGFSGITNPGHHGLSQVLYEYTSSSANNGSGFEGLADNTYFWNITTGLAMFMGRFPAIVIQLAIAGSLLKKHSVPESLGTLSTDTVTFAVSLFMTVIIISALTFFPALVLGPIAEYLTLVG